MIDLCDHYLQEIGRLYGEDCADVSVCRCNGDDCYLISIADEGSSGFELDGIPQAHTVQQVERMIEELSRRKPV